jgi:hypothetical protein
MSADEAHVDLTVDLNSEDDPGLPWTVPTAPTDRL